ncbi:MAG: tetratricopeptide repeat protein [Candidatus Hodarchaeota archaeon]
MSSSKSIIYPPEEVLNPPLGKDRNFELIILWMLNENKVCRWADFSKYISDGTLSKYLNRLKDQGYLEYSYNKYEITLAGKERFSELLVYHEEPDFKIKYPPDIIRNKRNYRHIVLWMLTNNDLLTWSDFREEPLKINSTALSKSLSSLKDKNFIEKADGGYKVTPLGKTEYFRILRLYDLDRQSILEEESKRIEEITEKTSKFFKNYKIEDDELKYRFLNHVLKLNYSKVESMLKSEEEFNKILLFLSINHPHQYPDYLSPEQFSLKYEIDLTTLNYYIQEIVDNQLFQIKFFILKDEQGGLYYFQKNEAIEKILNAIVEKYITKFTYLNKFKENTLQPDRIIDIELLLENILNDVCGNLFNNNLKPTLKAFLPEYIKYLAYKIESEKSLTDSEAKLEGFVWQSIFEEFQTFEPVSRQIGDGEEVQTYYTLNDGIFDVLEIFYITKLKLINTNEFKEGFNLSKLEIFDNIENALYKRKIFEAKNILENSSINFNSIEGLILKDLVLTADNNFDESFKTTTQIIDKFPDKYIGYLLQSITNFQIDNYEEALNIVEEGLEKAPCFLLEVQKAQILIKMKNAEKALKIIDETISNYPNSIPVLETKFIVYLTDWHILQKTSEDPLEIINSAIKLKPKNKELIILKSIYYCIIHNYKEAKRVLIDDIVFNYIKKNPRIDTAGLFILAYSYVARGKFEKALGIVKSVMDQYPNHPISYLTKALVLGYNLIYKFKLLEPNVDTFIGLIERAITLEEIIYNKTKFLLLQAHVLQGMGQNDDAIEAIDRAIDMIPNQYHYYLLKVVYLVGVKRLDEALETIDDCIDKDPVLTKTLLQTKSFIYNQQKRYQEAYDVLEELTELCPDNIGCVNNKAVILANLNRKEEAIETAEYLLSLNPKLGNSYDSYGEILMTFKEYDDAIEKFEKALELEPTGWFAYWTYLKMGKCYQELGKYDIALENYEKAKKMTEKMFPTEREYDEHDVDKYLSEIRSLIEKRKKNEK